MWPTYVRIRVMKKLLSERAGSHPIFLNLSNDDGGSSTCSNEDEGDSGRENAGRAPASTSFRKSNSFIILSSYAAYLETGAL